MEARDLRAQALENLAGNWAMSVGVAMIAGLLGGLLTNSGGSSIDIDAEVLAELPYILRRSITIYISIMGILGIARFVIGGTVELGYAQYLLKQYDRSNFELNDLFSQFYRFGQGFAQAFLRGLYTFLWALLLIIPGIIKGLAYSMTPFIMAENPNLTASEAITASKEMMDGYKGELFWLDLTFIGWDLLSVLTLGIGHLFLNPYRNAAHAAFYRYVKANRSSSRMDHPYYPE